MKTRLGIDPEESNKEILIPPIYFQDYSQVCPIFPRHLEWNSFRPGIHIRFISLFLLRISPILLHIFNMERTVFNTEF